jgi:hypoxanthine phosphoribosyltransferase
VNEITILGKTFRETIPEAKIKSRVAEIANQINNDLSDRDVVFLGILNGAFIFAADLLRHVTLRARISFVKLASYQGTGSSGVIKELIGWNEDVNNKTIVILEDIIDTGNTIERIVSELLIRKASEVRIAAMFIKPTAYTKEIGIDYTGFEMPDDFIIGYGLDYEGYGRNLPSVYTLVNETVREKI